MRMEVTSQERVQIDAIVCKTYPLTVLVGEYVIVVYLRTATMRVRCARDIRAYVNEMFCEKKKRS